LSLKTNKMMSATISAAPEALNGRKMTPEAYLARERQGIRELEGKYELFNQTLLFMAGASEAHNKIAGFILTILNNHIWQNDLEATASPGDMRVVSFLDYKDYFYPDVVFVIGNPLYADDQKDVLINPTILFEVLSDSTENFDRGEKFGSYKQIESLKEYILVSQYERRVEHFYKNTNGKWITGKVYKQGVLPLLSMPYSLPLKQIYHNMPF
jgi:Uma2 family endonuclease